jgi:hypothetical protein
MDHVLIVVDDLAATAFFVALGMELESETTIAGPVVDRLVGLEHVGATLALLRTPTAADGSRWTRSTCRKRSALSTLR